jgi:hypothetical protein
MYREHGAPEASIQALMTHADRKTTEIYLERGAKALADSDYVPVTRHCHWKCWGEMGETRFHPRRLAIDSKSENKCLNLHAKIWSGKRDSNSRPRPWQDRSPRQARRDTGNYGFA